MTLSHFLARLVAGDDPHPVGAVVAAGGHRFRKLPHGWVADYSA